jgi:hypothetical protein
MISERLETEVEAKESSLRLALQQTARERERERETTRAYPLEWRTSGWNHTALGMLHILNDLGSCVNNMPAHGIEI